MPPMWPSEGRIVFENVSLRYAPNEEPVLKNLNIVVESGWKVRIRVYLQVFLYNLGQTIIVFLCSGRHCGADGRW